MRSGCPNVVGMIVDRRSRVSLKLDNSQCADQCFASDTAAEFISQSLRKGQYKPVAPVASVHGTIPLVCPSLAISHCSR